MTTGDSQEVAADLKKIYQPDGVVEAEHELESFSAKRDAKYPGAVKGGRDSFLTLERRLGYMDAMPRDGVAQVYAPQTESELEAVRIAVRRSSPLGHPAWQEFIAKRLGLQAALRPRNQAGP